MSHVEISDKLGDMLGVIQSSLQFGYKTLAIAALVWCIWSWCSEWWLPALVATIFVSLILFDAFFIT
jgi:hypothetical protein